jgi:hypothetical protein
MKGANTYFSWGHSLSGHYTRSKWEMGAPDVSQQIIFCQDRGCNTPVAQVDDKGTVTLIGRHHGEKHTSTFSTQQPAPVKIADVSRRSGEGD